MTKPASRVIEFKAQVFDASNTAKYEVFTTVGILETEHSMTVYVEERHPEGNASLIVHTRVEHPAQGESAFWDWQAKAFIDDAIDKHNEWFALYLKGVVNA